MQAIMSGALGAMLFGLTTLPSEAATVRLSYGGGALSCDYAYSFETGPQDCPPGQTLPGLTAELVIDTALLPGGSLAGLELLAFNFENGDDEAPAYLLSAELVAPVYWGDRRTLVSYGSETGWTNPGAFQLIFDADGQIGTFAMAFFNEYGAEASSMSESLSGPLAFAPDPFGEVFSFYSGTPGTWTVTPVPVPAGLALAASVFASLALLSRPRG